MTNYSTFLAACAVFLAPLIAYSQTPCINGMAGGHACQNIDLMSFISVSDLGQGSCLNDCWGWTDDLDGKEYALVGGCNGTVFVDISDPISPLVLGMLPTHTNASIWRDIKVYANHAFIVSEAPGHGLQVFDLTRLRTVASPPVTFTADAHLGIFGNAHNIAINESSGRAYVIGANSSSSPAPNGGLVIIDISTPTSPQLIGSYTMEGYIHDSQCVTYIGPDADYFGKEICINSHSGNPDKKTITDVTDPSDVQTISSINWPNARIGHQGWLTEDQKYFLMGDEGDESFYGFNTRTYVFDVQDLDTPVLVGSHDGTNGSIDHNMYTHQGLVWQANYSSGLQVLQPLDLSIASLTQVGSFDSFTAHNNTSFDGAWSNYPYFESGNIIISDFDEGLFVVRPTPEINVKAFLNGPFDESSSLMNDDLRVLGLVPLTEPYTSLGYGFVGGGTEQIAASVLGVSGNDAIVDWVVLELRSAGDSSNVVYSRAALLQRDGDVVDLDGISGLRVDVAIDEYFVAIRHRNHLGTMSGSAVLVSIAQEDTLDFTDISADLYGIEPTINSNGIRRMWSGNVFNDQVLKYVGVNNDRDPILVALGGSVPTATATGYLLADANLDGLVKYTGPANDRDPILVAIGGSIPTALRQEQLP